jgi:hypothetical protein
MSWAKQLDIADLNPEPSQRFFPLPFFLSFHGVLEIHTHRFSPVRHYTHQPLCEHCYWNLLWLKTTKK